MGNRPDRKFWGLVGLILLAGLAAPRAAGDAVWGEVLPLQQPDGTVIDVRVWGDEFYRVIESLDGYTLVRDPHTDFACYARVSPDGSQLQSTGVPVESTSPQALGLLPHARLAPDVVRAKAAAIRADFAQRGLEALPPGLRWGPQPAPPTTGNVQGICLIVDFSDEPGTIPRATVDNFCNQVGYAGDGNNGSVRDYYNDVSDGALTYTNYVPDAYYRASQPKSYYNDQSVAPGTRARELIIEALQDLDNNGFDFSAYDANSDGYIDAVNCFYAGSRGAVWGVGLWPHSWTVDFSADGVSTYKYQITDMAGALTLRTFCHENGHMICDWPDLYDYGYESNGVGQYCLMSFGTTSTNPCEPCAYMKLTANWASVTDLVAPAAGCSVDAGTCTFYRFPHPSISNEYFLIENRHATGRDSDLPDTGLAIWHIDTNGSNDWEQRTPSQHYECTLVQADNDWDLENGTNYGDSTDLWAAPTYTRCGPSTDPDTAWWDGSDSTMDISSISATGTTITFDFTPLVDCNGNGIADATDIAGATSTDCNGNGVPDECEMDSLLKITSQPAATVVCSGSDATFSVTATGLGTLNYQWRKNGSDLAGQTASTLTISSTSVADAGTYDVVVSNACGTVTSNGAGLSVSTAPVIDTPPASQTVKAGELASLYASVTSAATVSYQWRFNGTDISGATESQLTLWPVELNDAGTYDVVVTNACGTATSTAATLTVELDEPQMRAPKNGATDISASAFLYWALVSDATSYEVYFGTTESPPLVGTTTNTNWSPGNLEYNTTYYWRVVARNDQVTITGPTWSFTTEAAPSLPAAPTNPYPPDAATDVALQTVLGWNGASGATDVHVVLTTDRTKVEGEFDVQDAQSTTGSLVILTAGKTYYWRVWAENDAGMTPGPIWSFSTVAQETLQPWITDPENVGFGTGDSAPEVTASNVDTSNDDSNANEDANNDAEDILTQTAGCPSAAVLLLAFVGWGLWATRTRYNQ